MTTHLSTAWQLSRTTALPHTRTSRRQFFFSERLPARARNVTHAYAPVQKLGVILDATQDLGEGSVSTFCSTITLLEDGRYRMYYTATSLGDSSMWIAVAESADGLAWEKRPLGQHKLSGRDTNRIVFESFPEAQDMLGQPQVLRLPDGTWRMYFWHLYKTGYDYVVAHSQDGLRWRADTPLRTVMVGHGFSGTESLVDGWEPGTGQDSLSPEEIERLWGLKAIRTNDASFVYYNSDLERFEYYAQWFVPAVPDRTVKEDNCKEVHRFIQRRFSADGLAWSAPQLIIMPDDRDPWDQQFYHLAVQYHEDWMIGSIGHYRVEADQQTQDLELVFSRDGRRWHRPLRGAFIPRDPDTPAARDSMGIYPPNAWLDKGDTWLCLYGGTHTRHNEAVGKDPTKTRPIMGARWKKNRFVGISAGRLVGGFLTEPFYPQQPVITLDAHIRGWLRAELCDVFGRKHEGYHLMDAVPVAGDDTAHVLRWRDRHTVGFQQDAVRLRFEFVDGVVYSVGF